MPGKEDISNEIGKKYNLLTIIKDLGSKRTSSGKCVMRYVLVKCECGKEFEVRLLSIRNENTISCGCIIRQAYRKYGLKIKKHHKSKTKEHNRWWDMIARCYCKGSKAYKYYGKRGITVCKEWIESFDNFIEDMGLPPTEKHTIDRIDVNGNYCKENCRWATMKQQSINRRNNNKIEYNGENLTLSQWSEKLNFNHSILGKRLKRGWTFEKAILTPVKNNGYKPHPSLSQNR